MVLLVFVLLTVISCQKPPDFEIECQKAFQRGTLSKKKLHLSHLSRCDYAVLAFFEAAPVITATGTDGLKKKGKSLLDAYMERYVHHIIEIYEKNHKKRLTDKDPQIREFAERRMARLITGTARIHRREVETFVEKNRKRREYYVSRLRFHMVFNPNFDFEHLRFRIRVKSRTDGKATFFEGAGRVALSTPSACFYLYMQEENAIHLAARGPLQSKSPWIHRRMFVTPTGQGAYHPHWLFDDTAYSARVKLNTEDIAFLKKSLNRWVEEWAADVVRVGLPEGKKTEYRLEKADCGTSDFTVFSLDIEDRRRYRFNAPSRKP